jgi:hypothetical protein
VSVERNERFAEIAAPEALQLVPKQDACKDWQNACDKDTLLLADKSLYSGFLANLERLLTIEIPPPKELHCVP